jgi:NodT family efflux transporter outer membrane factor (OMF) lipoprotein
MKHEKGFFAHIRVFKYTLFLLLLTGLLHSCIKVGPDYEAPETEMPDSWHQTATYGINDRTANLWTWWTLFNDPVLDDLIMKAREGNYDLKIAVTSVNQARTQVYFTAGEYLPSVQAQGSVERSRASEGVTLAVPPPQTRTDTFIDIGGSASWEIDLWGRIARSVESSEASYEASIENYRDTLVVLFAEIASNYVQVRTLQSRIKIALQNIERQQKTLKLTRDRFDAGISPLLDVRQAELNLATTEATVPQLQASLDQTMNRIEVLLGEDPGTLQAELSKPSSIPLPPDDIAIGLPAELLRQRPDIRLAEREVAAQTAQIGVATSELYPQFSIFGTLSLQAVDSVSFFKASNLTFGFGPQFVWRIFEGGRLRYNIKIQELVAESLIYQYQNTVLLALEEVENSMVAYVQEINRNKSLGEAVSASESAVELVRTLYIEGLTDFLNVLDTQRALFQQQDQFIESRGDIVQNLISLYKSLGGGWSPESDKELYSQDTFKEIQSAYVGDNDEKSKAKSKSTVK